jgi:hypothetical protein
MIGTVLAIAGTVMSGVQAIQQNQKKKQAEASAKALANQAKEMKMKNAFAGLQVADKGERLAMEYGAQADISALEALKASPEGAVGGVAALANQTRQRDLEIGAALSEKEAERDRQVAAGQQVADMENFRTQQDILSNQISGAQMAAADAEAQRNAAIQGAVTNAASAVGSIGNNEGLDYKSKNESTVSKNAFKKSYNPNVSKNPDPSIATGNYGQPINTDQLMGGVDWNMFNK